MKGVLNGELVEVQDLSPLLFERGYNYGDGLFETIMLKNGRARFLDHHVARLRAGMKALSMESPGITVISIQNSINLLKQVEEVGNIARIKLLVWRKSGGLYTPGTNAVESLLFFTPFTEREAIVKKVDIAEKASLHFSPLSRYKTISALPYVLAGIEKKEKGLDEIILLDNHQNLSECSSSNLFWLKDEVIYTPSLASGCIAGVMRTQIMQEAALAGRAVIEVLEKPDTLNAADQVFCCNVTGVYLFESFQDKKLDISLNPDIDRWVNQ